MFLLSTNGWFNGLLAGSNIIFGYLIGIFIIYISIKNHARLLTYAGFMIIFIWSYQLGTLLDFITILSTGDNFNNSNKMLGILNWMWVCIGVIIQVYFAAEMIIPEKKVLKRVISVSALILMLVGIVSMFYKPENNFVYYYPKSPGEDLIYFHFAYNSIPFLILLIGVPFTYIFVVGGFLYKGMKLKGILGRKYVFSALAVFLCATCKLLEGSLYLGNFYIFTKAIDLISGIFWYLSLREESMEPKKEKRRKDVKIEESLFRLRKKPELITEEEISISKEKKICLVCKGTVIRFNFICPNCEAFYCANCAKAIMDLENACWACNSALDESKPIELPDTEEKVEIHGKSGKDFS